MERQLKESVTEGLSAGDMMSIAKDEDDSFDLPPHDVWMTYVEDKNAI